MKAGLIDADIHGPSVPTLLGLKERAQAIDKKLIPMEAHGIRALSVGMMIDTDRAIAWRGPMVAGALNQLLADAEWGDTDPIVLDMPPGTGDIQLTVVQKRSEEHTSELQSLMRNSYAVFCLKKKTKNKKSKQKHQKN